jgi:putative restriction endonuclease
VYGASYDDRLRAAAIAYVARLEERNGGFVREDELNRFEFEGKGIALLQYMRGIRVVSGVEAALTIRTTYRLNPEDRPYEDDPGPDGLPRYKWRGSDPDAYDNKALRRAMELGKPLIWFRAVAPGVFQAVNPVWLVAEEPEHQQFVVSVEQDAAIPWAHLLQHPEDEPLQREYIDALVKRRVHQPFFRQRVIAAYRRECALCHLRHTPLLDAAHIKEDSEGGEPIVPNGVAMCAIHHRAFDNDILGIRPDYVVEIRSDVLLEADGPTLQHAIQGLHASELALPKRQEAWPRQDLLEERYERFKAAS